MGTLGVGVRVQIGWAPDSHCGRSGKRSRLKVGVIVDGPVRAGEWYPVYLTPGYGLRNASGNTAWVVWLDEGRYAAATEPYLIPLDGDDDAETDAERVNEPEAECSVS